MPATKYSDDAHAGRRGRPGAVRRTWRRDAAAFETVTASATSASDISPVTRMLSGESSG